MPPKAPVSTDELPERFRVAPSTLWFDWFMTRFIRIGGVLVIGSVAAIFVFILTQIIPLFRGATVEELKTVPAGPAKLLGVDEWSELPVLIARDGSLTFVDVAKGTTRKVMPEFADGRKVSAVAYQQAGQRVIVGTEDGRFALVPLNYSMSDRGVTADPKPETFYEVGPEGSRVIEIAYGDSGDTKLAAAICEVAGKWELHAATLTQKRSLMGKGKIEVGDRFNLTSEIQGRPERLLVNAGADSIIVSTDAGEVDYFFLAGDKLLKRQSFKPFGKLPNARMATIDFLFGDVSLVCTSISGDNLVYSLYVPKGSDQRLWGQTKTFRSLPNTPSAFAASSRNKSFVLASGATATLRHSTTESIRWEKKLPFSVQDVVLSGKHDRIIFLDEKEQLHLFKLSDPHPEASWHALFGKLWYEGASEPKYEWQSTGGTDDFEPKLSMVPLLFGTLKGTLYALVFALPIALLAALYTAQFLEPRFKRVVKPVMEIMASLPSVVLGFIAALWLAPLLETRVPSVIVCVILIPSAAWFFGWFWAGLPYEKRRRIPQGMEFLVFAPVLLFVGWLGWKLGPWVERVVFTVPDAAGGRLVDFRPWWTMLTGADFQQRNSLVVGFIMGFAVIPIIFTIAEDALSNVPSTLSSGSLALGASRWQTAIHIVLPTASAGIFSALMIGLGRAVGETMIVVMATGNTPIMDMNIFNGMRTLSANIAVELPEAPHHGTLYRTLFLGAMLLFIMTFAINTVAEVLRHRLREKFKTV